MVPPAPLDDHALAADVAAAAGALLVDLRAAGTGAPGRGFDHADGLRAAGDRRAHTFIIDRLHEARPDDAVLSEEGVDDIRRLDADRVWVVDPLDGTREFGEPGRTDWAVHVALVAGGLL
ncbi:MAG: hypothetical protein M3R01_05580, partial [Actinomycetota bacterium]|nr:hypothetical protein [Actinomycetota bacterium]